MKLLIDFDYVGDLTPLQFDDVITKLTFTEVRIICTGFPGRTGDKYDILREKYLEYTMFTEGIPPRLYLSRIDWNPDVTVSRPYDFSNVILFKGYKHVES